MLYNGYIILLALPNDFVILATVKLHGYMNLFSRIFRLLAVGLISTASVLAQGEANVWYFGENGGLDFSTSPATVIAGKTGVDGNTDIMESSSTMADANGNILFSVVGKNIYSADGVVRGTLPNGSNWNVSQGSMIVKNLEVLISITLLWFLPVVLLVLLLLPRIFQLL